MLTVNLKAKNNQMWLCTTNRCGNFSIKIDIKKNFLIINNIMKIKDFQDTEKRSFSRVFIAQNKFNVKETKQMQIVVCIG